MKISNLVNITGTQVEKLITFLNAQPDDEIFTSSELRERLRCSFDGGSFAQERGKWKDYTTKTVIDHRVMSVWGNKTAIQNLKKALEDTFHES
jgi:hypothetical protein